MPVRPGYGPGLTVALLLSIVAPALATQYVAPLVGLDPGTRVLPGTTLSTTFFEGLVRRLDVPLAGRRVWPTLHVVVDPETNAGAHRDGDMSITTGMLEKVAGVKVDPQNPATLDSAVRAIQGDPRRLQRLGVIVGHELGHHAHGDTFGNRQAIEGRTFSDEADKRHSALWARLSNLVSTEQFRQASDEAMRPLAANLLQEHYTKYPGADADRALFLETLRATGNLRGALTTLLAQKSPADLGQRRINALLVVRDTPALHRYVDEPIEVRTDEGFRFMLGRKADGKVVLAGMDEAVARASRSMRSAPRHVSGEFMADEHGLLLQTNELRHRLELFSKVLPSGSPDSLTIPGATHPSPLARILNLVTLVQANPEYFATSLEEPMRLRIYRDLPALELQMVDGVLKVRGFKDLYKRLTPPERMLLHEYVSARKEAVAKESDGFLGRRLSGGGTSLEDRVRKGAAQNEYEGPLARRVDRMRDQLFGRRPFDTEEQVAERYRTQRVVIERLARTANSLLAIMIMNATTQYCENGSVDYLAAVTQTLNSPDVWAGLAAGGLLDLATPTGKDAAGLAVRGARGVRDMLAPTGRDAASWMSLFGGQTLAERIFVDQLLLCKSTVVALATFRVVSAYLKAASTGIDNDGRPLGMTDLFAGKGEKGRQFLRNLGTIALSPSAHATILGHVLRDQLLTFEFAFGAIGAVAFGQVGAAAGALAGTWMATQVGTVGGFVVGGPGGALIGGVCGFVGGAVAGGVGMWAMGAVGASLDTQLLDWRYDRALEQATRQLASGGSADQARTLLRSLASLRARLVTNLTTQYARAVRRVAATKGGDEAAAANADAARLRNGIQDLYLSYLSMTDTALLAEACSLGRDELVEAENASLAEVVTLTSRLDGLLAAAQGDRQEPTTEASGPADAEAAPSFDDLVAQPAS